MLDFQELIKELESSLKSAKNENEAIIIKNTFTKKNLSPLYQQLKNLPAEQKHDFGQQVNSFKEAINKIADTVISNLQQKALNEAHKPVADVLINTIGNTIGALNPITLITKEIIEFFRRLDFEVVTGNEVVDTKFNFYYLNFTKDHPGRLTSESFYFGPNTMLRAHNTAISAEAMHKNKNAKDLRVLTWGNVYRNDDDDLTHSHQFTQIDIVWVKEGLTVANLKWILTSFLQYLYGKDVKLRFRLSYFIFTEPSIEVDVECPRCHGKGCPMCKHSGYIEVLGSGMWNQNVLKYAGFKTTTGFAAGIGIERLAMIKYGITDIRDLYNNDFRFLKQARKENK